MVRLISTVNRQDSSSLLFSKDLKSATPEFINTTDSRFDSNELLSAN